MDILQSAASNREKDGNTDPDTIKVKMKTSAPVSSITKLTNVISSCVTIGNKKEASIINNSSNGIHKKSYSHIINANIIQVDNDKTTADENDDDTEDDDGDSNGHYDSVDRDIMFEPKLYIDESRTEMDNKPFGKHKNPNEECKVELKLTKTAELPMEAKRNTMTMVKKASISAPELTDKENRVQGSKDSDRFVHKLHDTSVQPNMSPDSTTYIGDDISSQKIQRKVSFIFVKNSFVCLKCLKRFYGVFLFRKHIWWHLHGNTLKDYLCPYCNHLTEKSKCPTVSKIVRLLLSSASNSTSSESISVFGSENMSHNSENAPHKKSMSQQPDNSDYCWGKLKSKQVTSSSVLEHGVSNLPGIYDDDDDDGNTNKPTGRIGQSLNISNDTPLNLSISSAHKTNLFSDSKNASIYGDTEASLAKDYSQNSYHSFLEVEENQLIFSGALGVYFCQSCNSSYESTKSFYAHILWHLDCQLALCSPCTDQCEYLDNSTKTISERTCCLMAYILQCLSKDDTVKKQLKVCWKFDEKYNITFTVYVTLEGNTDGPADISKLIPIDCHSGYSVKNLAVKDVTSPCLASLPIFNSSDCSSLIDHNSEKTTSYTGRQSKGLIAIILYQNIYECLNCKEEMCSRDLLDAHLFWHIHTQNHLCTFTNCLTKQSCPVLNNVLTCVPVWESSFKVQIPFTVSWEMLPGGKINFSVHFMNRYNKTDDQLNLTVCEEGNTNTVQHKISTPEAVSFTGLKKTGNVEEISSGEENSDTPALNDVQCVNPNATINKEKHRSPSRTLFSQKKSDSDNLIEVDNIPSQSTSETEKNQKSTFEGFEKMSFICKSDQYICLDCSKHFLMLSHFKLHIMWHFHVLNNLCSHSDNQTINCPILRNILLCLPDMDKMTKTVEIHWKKESSGKTTFKVQTYYLKPAKPKVNLESRIDFTGDNSDSDTVIVIDDDIDDNEMLLRQSDSSISFDSSVSSDTAVSQQATATLTAIANNENVACGSSASISTTTLTEDSVCTPMTEDGNSSKTFPTISEENSVCTSPTSLAEVSNCTAVTLAEDNVHTPSTPHTESATSVPSLIADDGVHTPAINTLAIDTTSIALSTPAPCTISVAESIRTSPNTIEQDSVKTLAPTPVEDSYYPVSTKHPAFTNMVESGGAVTDNIQVNYLSCETKSVNEHSIGGFYVCGSKDCHFSSLTLEPFSEHFTQVHSDAAAYPCAHCHIQTETIEKLLKHMDLHASNKMFLLYQCSILSCKYGTNLRVEFANHLQFCHHSKSVYLCRYCKMSHQDVNSLIKHLESNLLKFIQCPHCSAKDTNRFRILSHIRLTHSEKPRQIIVSSQIICAKKRLNAAVPLVKHTKQGTVPKATKKLVEPERNLDFSKATKTTGCPADFTGNDSSNEDKTDDESQEIDKELTAAIQSNMDDNVTVQGEERLLVKSTECLTNKTKSVSLNTSSIEKEKLKTTEKHLVRKLKVVLKRLDNSVILKSENKNKSLPISPKVTTPVHKERNVFQLFNEIGSGCQINSSSEISSTDCHVVAAMNIDENTSSPDNEQSPDESSVEQLSNIKETWFNEISLGGPMLNSRLKICFTSEQGKYKCLLCPSIFSTVYKIHLHLLSDHFNWPLWNCMDCGVRFYSLSKIRSHCWRKHKFKDHNIKPLPLPLITMDDDGKPCVNTTKPLLDSEKKKFVEESVETIVDNTKTTISIRREKTSAVRSKRRKNTLKVSSEKNCKLCSFSYKKRMELIIHMVLSHIKELKTSITEKEVTLIEESIIRDESGKFICPFCEHSCNQRVDCKIHIWRVHVGLKYLNCQHCNFVTWFSSCLQKHNQEEHKTEEHDNSATRADTSENGGLAIKKFCGIDSGKLNHVRDSSSLSGNGHQPDTASVDGSLQKSVSKQTCLPTVDTTVSADATMLGCKRKRKEPEEVTRKLNKKTSVQHKRKWKKNRSSQKKSVSRLSRVRTENKKNIKDTNELVESHADVSSAFLPLFQQTPSESTLINDQTS